MLRHKKGQSTLEYVLLVTAVVVVLIAFLTSNRSPFKTTLNATLNKTTQVMDAASNRWSNGVRGAMGM